MDRGGRVRADLRNDGETGYLKGFSLLGSQKTVLVLSDDAVAVYTPVRGRFSFLGDVKWGDPDFLTALSDLLTLKGRSRPVMILYDMVEQYYRKETVPKVAILDQRRVIERRLTAAFPNYPLRACLALKPDKKGPQAVALTGAAAERANNNNNQDSGKSNNKSPLANGLQYLFAALPDMDQIGRLTDVIRLSMTVATSLSLLPIESVSMVRQLSLALNDGQSSPDRWIVFMAQHRGGGLRQIVVRNGELALTRLTPIVDTDIEPANWASEVAQEFSATMGYLSRFGYGAHSELEVIALGNSEALSQLQKQIKSTYFHGISVREAAAALRLSVDIDADSRYGDVIHVAWLARKIRVVLPFTLKELAFVSRARMAAKAVAGVLALAAVGAVSYAGYQGWNLIVANQAYAQAENVLGGLEKEYAAEVKRKDEFRIDVKLVQGSIVIFDRLEKNKIDILDFIQALGRGAGNNIAFDKIQMGYQVIKEENPDPMAVQTIEKKIFVAQLGVSFDPSIKPEIGNKMVSDLRDRIDAELDDTYTVTVDQSVRDLTFRSDFKYETGQDVENTANQGNARLAATIGIRKRPITNDQPAGN